MALGDERSWNGELRRVWERMGAGCDLQAMKGGPLAVLPSVTALHRLGRGEGRQSTGQG